MMPPRLSVLVPVYNAAPFLPECLESVLAQDFQDMEILLGDNCSSDCSREIIASYAARDRRIRWWKNPENLGMAGNLNQCFDEARGDYVKYIMADDKLVSSDALTKLVNVVEQRASVSLVGCDALIIDHASQVLSHRQTARESGIWNGKKAIVHCLEAGVNLLGTDIGLFRRAHARFKFDARYSQIIDLDFCFRLLEHGEFAYVTEPLVAWRQHASQATVNNKQSGAFARDEVNLARDWTLRPWMTEFATRKMFFNQIRHLRNHGPEAEGIATRLKQQLGRGWYAAYWTRRKVFNPLKKLARRVRRLAGDKNAGNTPPMLACS